MASQREWFEKDYYKVLGVKDTADAKEITKAYRKLARESHPDTHPGDSAAEERFKEVSTAYDVLGERLAQTPFLAGEAFTFGDVGAAIAVDGLAHEGIAVPARLRPWLERCYAVEAMRASREAALPFIESTRAMRAAKR